MPVAPFDSKIERFVKGCTSCRITLGISLLASGVFVHAQANKRPRLPMRYGTIAMQTFSFALLVWGVIILVDPIKGGNTSQTDVVSRSVKNVKSEEE
uniref:distal membrane-arm assembly complex protein 1-like n=1 Tax=Myxine glutinosa TaxID=7769 RepID=UPI00358F3F70